MAVSQRQQTWLQPLPEDDPNAIAAIADAEMLPTSQPSPDAVQNAPISGVIPKSFVEYSADPVNNAKIPEPVPAGTPMPAVAAKAARVAAANGGYDDLFPVSAFDTSKPPTPAVPAVKLAGPPTPTLEDSLFSAGGYQPEPTPAQPGQPGPRPTGQPPSFSIPTREEILAAHPPVLPARPWTPHGGKQWLGLSLATAADSIGAALTHGEATVGPGLMKNVQAAREYDLNLPQMRQQAENAVVDEQYKQLDTAAQIQDRLAEAWKRQHPNVPPPKVNFSQIGRAA